MIAGQMKLKIDGWRVKDKKFICTKACNYVYDKIRSKSCVAVIGNGGSGKSTIVRHISLLLLDKYSYEITLVSSPEELRNFYKPGRKTVFVLDDLCGKFTADHTEIDHWCSMKDVVELVMEDKACKILFSCRLQVYKDEAFIDLEPFRSCACNIISEELSLTKEEKKQIFQKYLKLKNIDEDIFLRKNDMFPLLCELYSNEKEQKDVNLYFNTPYQVYLDDLDKLGRKGKHKLCGLCLCIMFNNQLKESEFLTPSVKFPQIFKEVCNYCKINEGTSPILIRDEINTLVNTYINKHDELYEIYHDKLFDFLAFYFGKKMTHCFIKHADSSFLRDRFVWKNAIDTADQSNENIVLLKDCYLKAYIERMKSDWANGKVSDVFYNINMRNQSFREEFLKLLIDVDKELATNLSNMKDTFREDFASGNTPLIISCMHGYVDLLEWLISNKADVNEQRKDGSSGLFMGCEKNHVAIVKLLLEKDADVGVCTVEGVSPLGIACYYHGNLEIISMLLVKIDDVDKHRFTKINMTPLFMACEKNFLAVAKKLLEQKANPNICLRDGMSVLLAACQKQYPNIVHLLLKYKANPNVGKYDGNTPLFSACGMGFKDIAEMLINYGADLNKCVHSRETIELKRSTKSFERLKESWLKAAKSFGSQKTKEYIQNKSADYVFDVVTGSSPLHVACYMGHYEISKLLIENLLCVDIRKQNGITPLFYACEIGHFDIVNELLKKGADQTFCRGNQRSPLEIAKLNEHVNIVELLERMGSCTS